MGVFAAALLAVILFAPPAAARDEVQLYECTAHEDMAGRVEPSAGSPESRWPDGRLRQVEKGDPGYAGAEKGKPLPEWLELFATPRGHGNTFLGFYPSRSFTCTEYAG